VTVREAAEALEVSSGLVYRLLAAGKIRHERHGLGRGAIRIPPGALDEYRRSCTVGVRQEAAAASPSKPTLSVRLKHVHLPS
jgi:excisionase family DNA binding protein